MREARRSSPDDGTDPALAAALRKVTWRLMPFLGLCYLVAYLDRVNVGFAKLQMASQLGLSEAAYGLGAGIFFFGYFLFEVPSNLILHRVGAKTWLARIMITWAVVSAAMMLLAPLHRIWGEQGSRYAFYALRFLLGLAEAGFFPGILLYLTYWFPPSRRSFALALFILAQPVAFVFGAPLSGAILDRFDGVAGLAGWQWMYLIEATPALALGLWLPFRLDNGISGARWLTPAEQALLTRAKDAEADPERTIELKALARNGLVWLFALAYFLLTIGGYGVNFWLPTIVKASGIKDNLVVGLVTAAPYLVSVVVMLTICARMPPPPTAQVRSALMIALGGLGLAASAAFGGQFLPMMAGLTLGVTGLFSATALFWCAPSAALDGRAVAAGLAAINALANVGGFVGPYLMGLMASRFGDTKPGLYVLAGAMIAAGAVLVLARRPGRAAAPAAHSPAPDTRPA